jgi:1,4-dihydroxy-2-naphthoate octaprenyltransferase
MTTAETLAPLSVNTWVRMTRPGFLAITVVACILGISTAVACGHPIQWGMAAATLLLAVLMHAAANVLNDYHDALNGADDANQHGLFPFTGGARMIQTGEVSLTDTRDLVLALLLIMVPAGLWLAVQTGGGLVALGLAGLMLGWAYSAPPLALMMRGLGEFTVGLAWLLVVVGADYVQRGAFFFMPWAVGLSYGLLISNILVINGFPDAQADAQVGKRTWVVRMGAQWAAVMYGFLALLAHAWVALGVWWFIHPEPALWGLLSLPVSLLACVWLFKKVAQPERLTVPIVLTILAAVLHGLAMATGLLFLGLD